MDILSRKKNKSPCYFEDMAKAGRPADLPRTDFGDRLFRAREAAGLSQMDVAEELGVSQQLVAAWERKSKSIRIDLLPQLAILLNVSIDELMGSESGVSHKQPGPQGRLRKLFERASKLPRRQQDKLADVLEPFVVQHDMGQ